MKIILIILAIIYILGVIGGFWIVWKERKQFFDISNEPYFRFLKYKNKYYIDSMLAFIYFLFILMWPAFLIGTMIVKDKSVTGRKIEMQ